MNLDTTLPEDLTEAVFQTRVTEYARWTGWRFSHFMPGMRKSGRWSTAMQGHTGYPDLTLVRDEQLIFAELKTNRGYPTRQQREWHDALARVPGALVVVWRPRDWPDIQQILARPPHKKDTA